MAPLPLPELQSRLRALISDPSTLTCSDEALEPVLGELSIHGDARLSAAQRLRIYARMYFLRLRDALASDFPALRRAVGDAPFDEITRRYLAAYPSDRPSLRDLGRHLPGHTHANPELVATWQAEIAQLEWAMVEAFDAPDQPVLDESCLDLLPAEDWPQLPIRPVGSVVLLACTTAADLLRERLLGGEAVTAVTPEPEPVLLRVWRQEHQVYVRRTSAREMAALRWIHAGVSFAELCGWLGEHNPDDPAGEAIGLLRRWLEDGLLVAPLP